MTTSQRLLTFACDVTEHACPAAECRGVTRNSLDEAESSSSVPESEHVFSLMSDITLYNIAILALPLDRSPKTFFVVMAQRS